MFNQCQSCLTKKMKYQFKSLTFAGTFAVLSLMTGSVVEQLVPIPLALNSSSPEAAELEAQRIGVASAVAFLSGIMMVRQFCCV